MINVVICQYRLLHYRIDLFDLLRQACLDRGIVLNLVHGQASKSERKKKDEGTIAWATRVKNVFFTIFSKDIVWQPLPKALRSAALIVVMQENRILSNYPLLISRLWSRRKIAYWGHGVNFQSHSPGGLREKWKVFLLKKVDWWFAYTEATSQILLARGYPADQITVLNNAISNDQFMADLNSVSDLALKNIRDDLGLAGGSPVGLFCGSLYADKRIAFLLKSADLVRHAIPDFSLVIVGDGPGAGEIRAAMAERPWLKWVGVRKGAEKAAYFRLASIVFNPGAVGLHVLDSFCSGVPMLTTSDAKHGPEIAYLEDGVNGVVVRGGPEAYAAASIGLLQNPARYALLKQGALLAARRYTLDNMVARFADGLAACVAAGRSSR